MLKYWGLFAEIVPLSSETQIACLPFGSLDSGTASFGSSPRNLADEPQSLQIGTCRVAGSPCPCLGRLRPSESSSVRNADSACPQSVASFLPSSRLRSHGSKGRVHCTRTSHICLPK